ncbi:MAG TPA: DUF115 domain-containing protein [Sediminispirochaeta sp.]|nr:DUF115 domain-containing protein [Sediminispirochaeta sp.]
MNTNGVLSRNMLSLSSAQPALSARIGAQEPSIMVDVVPSKSGEPVPVLFQDDRKYYLHSRIDPEKEGRRFYDSSPYGGYLVFLGFGAGHHILPYLKRNDISGILIIDYDAALFKSILAKIDLRPFFLDSRVRFLIEPQPEEIVKDMLDNYLPAVSGNFHLLQLRARVQSAPSRFNQAKEEIQRVLKSISEDYSVQSYFGKRWFINSLENLKVAEFSTTTLPPIRHALITAAGPSLELQLNELKRLKSQGTLIATDTSLPFLLNHDILPDMVISIDCQHVTYHHFMSGYPERVPLILDLASPNHLTRQTDKLVFFTSGHPFSRYVNSNWRRFPFIDTSGGNVGHAAVSLAEALGAQRISLFGMDFSFPNGKSYARGTYLYPFFQHTANRFLTTELSFMKLLFRNDSIIKIKDGNNFRYTTRPMISYKERLEQAFTHLNAKVEPMPGRGEPIRRHPGREEYREKQMVSRLFSAGAAEEPWEDFLRSYREALLLLPEASESLWDYKASLNKKQRDILTTLYPAAAAMRREHELIGLHRAGARIIPDVIDWSVAVIDSQLEALE